jgi:DNA topoisomerase IB
MRGPKPSPKMLALTRRQDLHYVTREQLTIERRRGGDGFAYWAGGSEIRNPALLRRFGRRAAMPPDACNTAITPSGRRFAKHQRRNVWRRSLQQCRSSAAPSRSI